MRLVDERCFLTDDVIVETLYDRTATKSETNRSAVVRRRCSLPVVRIMHSMVTSSVISS